MEHLRKGSKFEPESCVKDSLRRDWSLTKNRLTKKAELITKRNSEIQKADQVRHMPDSADFGWSGWPQQKRFRCLL